MSENSVTEYSVRLVRERTVPYQGMPINGAWRAAQLLHQVLDDSPVERVVVIYLSGAGRVQGLEVVSQGGISSSSLRPSEVFRGALLACASSIVIGHNHPSGDPTPSKADLTMTEAVVAAGALLGIPLMDHVIVSSGSDVSLLEEGLMPRDPSRGD